MLLKNLIRWLKTSRWAEPILVGIDAVLWLTDLLAVWSVGKVAVQPGSLAVIKLDALGDYLLLRPYLRYLKQHPAYCHSKLTLVGNGSCQTIAEQFDAGIIDSFLWADIYRLATQPLYRFRFVRKLRQLGIAMVFCPTYSRVLVLDDFLAYATGASKRVGVRGDLAARKLWEANIGNRLFTKLLDSQEGIVFETERNRQTLSCLLDEDVPLLAPSFEKESLPSVPVPQPNVVISLGAGQPFRVWPSERFATVVKYILTEYPNHHILLTGAPSEQVYSTALLALVPPHPHLHDLTGKLSLIELIAVLKQADLLLANETGTVHLAASVQTSAVVVSQGRTLVRWHPYPLGMADFIHYVYPPFIEENRHRLADIALKFNPESPFQIKEISAEQVLNQIVRLLSHS